MPGGASGMMPLLSIILTVTACSGFPGAIISADDGAGPSPQVTLNSPGLGTPSPPLEIPGTPTSMLTPKPLTPTVLSKGSQRFQMEQRSHTDQEAMRELTLVLHSAELSADELSLRIGFENTSDETFSLIGHFEKQNVLLIDAAGQPYEPLRISENLQQISPPDGFAPGQANVGNVVFPRPGGPEPYELRLSKFDPIQFRLNIPLPNEAEGKVPPGDYLLEARLHSADETLAPLELRVHSVQVTTDSLTLLIGFFNASTQPYGWPVSLTGGDVRLQDAEGSQYKPAAVSETLQNSLAPEQRWEPSQEHRGH